jgi:predicted amidohydrolase YtcJ
MYHSYLIISLTAIDGFNFVSFFDRGLTSRKNVTLALGSDFPVSAVSPFLGIHAAFTRRKPGRSETDDPQGWDPSERIESIHEIIDGFTTHASFAGFTENLTGSLRVGKLADLVIIDQNLFDPSKSRDQISDRILDANVLATVLNGRVVFGKI